MWIGTWQQLANQVLQSTDQPHGTVCHQHHGHRTCRRAPTSGHWRRTCSRPPVAIETVSWFWRRISRLTYLRCHQLFTRPLTKFHRELPALRSDAKSQETLLPQGNFDSLRQFSDVLAFSVYSHSVERMYLRQRCSHCSRWQKTF